MRARTEQDVTDVTPTPLKRFYSQVCDPGFAHGARDGFDGRAQRIEQIGQLPGAFGPPPLLHDEAGHGDHVGVEGPPLGHGCGRSSPEQKP